MHKGAQVDPAILILGDVWFWTDKRV